MKGSPLAASRRMLSRKRRILRGSFRAGADRIEDAETPQIEAAAGDHRGRGNLVGQLILRHQLELRSCLDHAHCSVAGGQINLAIDVNWRRAINARMKPLRVMLLPSLR